MARTSRATLVAKDAAFSPRVGVVLDPLGDQKWSVTASFAQYVAALEQRDRRLDLGWRQSPDLPLRVPRSQHQRRPELGHAHPDAGRDSTDLRLVLRQRCGQAPVHESARCSGRDTADSRQPEVAQRAGIRRRHQSPVRQPCGGACGLRVQELPRLLHRADRHQHRHRHRRVRPGLRPDAGGELERAEAPVQGGHDAGHVSNRERAPTSARPTRCRGPGATSTARTWSAVRSRAAC